MIRIQIIEKEESGLYSELIEAMRSGDLRTFSFQKHGRKIVHNKYPGWMNWSKGKGVIVCEILSPQKLGQEWKFMSAFIGRLADKYSARIHSIAIQFVER